MKRLSGAYGEDKDHILSFLFFNVKQRLQVKQNDKHLTLFLNNSQIVESLFGIFLFFCFFVFFEMESKLCRPDWSAVAGSQLTESSASWVYAILLPQPPE